MTGQISSLPTLDVVPIHLVLKKAETKSTSWPAQTLARLGVYCNGQQWYRIAPMHEWNARAELDKAKECMTFSNYSLFVNGHG